MNWQPYIDSAWNFGRDQLPKIVGVLLALFVAYLVAGWVKRLILRAVGKTRLDATLAKFFANIARYAILTFAVLGCLGVFGIETSSFAAVIAALGLAVGLAFQGTLSNFAAGVMLLLFRPFRVGDFVEAGGTMGTVEEIDLFTTEMKTPDNKMIIMPNGEIFGAKITNFNGYPTRRVDVNVGTDYSADTREVRRVLEALLPTIDMVHAEPPPQVFLKELGGSSIDWQLRVWTDTPNYWAVFQELTHRTKEVLDENGIGIPFPQMDVHVDGKLGE